MINSVLQYVEPCDLQWKEHVYMCVWKKWHLEFVRRKAIQKVEAFERKQQITMVNHHPVMLDFKVCLTQFNI